MSCLLRRIPPQVAPRRRGSSLKPNRGYPQPASAPAVRFGPPKTALRRITEIRFPCGGLEVTRRLKSPPTEAHSRPSGDCGRPARRAELPRREANAPLPARRQNTPFLSPQRPRYDLGPDAQGGAAGSGEPPRSCVAGVAPAAAPRAACREGVFRRFGARGCRRESLAV